MHPEEAFNVPIRAKGEYCTIYGSIGGVIGTPVGLIYDLATTTNKENTVEFFKLMRKQHQHGVIHLLLDNHRVSLKFEITAQVPLIGSKFKIVVLNNLQLTVYIGPLQQDCESLL